MDKAVARERANNLIIAINGGGPFRTNPNSMGVFVRHNIRVLSKQGYPDQARRIDDEWLRKQDQFAAEYKEYCHTKRSPKTTQKGG